jgi:hypothetical protein
LVACSTADRAGNVSSGTFVVTVRAVTPPRAPALAVFPGMLWPPNHKMAGVSVVPSGQDAAGRPFTCRIASIGSSEPVNGLGDGDSAPDWVVTGDRTASLRAERAGSGPGRVYSIEVHCTDSSNNVFAPVVTVEVPHDR